MEELNGALSVPVESAREPGDPSSATAASPPAKHAPSSSSKELLDSIPVLPDVPESNAIPAAWGGVVSEPITVAACEGAEESAAPEPLLLQGPEADEPEMAPEVRVQAPLVAAVETVPLAAPAEEESAVAAELLPAAAHRNAPEQPADSQTTLLERQPTLALLADSSTPPAEPSIASEPAVDSPTSGSRPSAALAHLPDGEPGVSAEVATLLSSGSSQANEVAGAGGSAPATTGTPASGRKPRSRRPSGAGAAGSTKPLARSRSHPKALAPAAAATCPSGGAAGGQEGEDILAELEAQRARHAQQLTHEARAKRELEEMLVRIEKHFKNERAARLRAEEMLRDALGERAALASQLEAALAAGATARAAAEADLGQARSEWAALLGDAQREAAVWRVQAEASVRAVEEVRADLLARRQELDSTKAKMDALAERLVPPGAEAAAVGSAAPEALPRLKTRAVPGAVLASSLSPGAGPAAGLPSLAPRGMPAAATTGAWATPPSGGSSASMRHAASGISFVVGGGRPDRRRASPPDREAESKRDAAMIAHQTRWQ